MRDKALWIERLKDLPDGAGFAFRELLTEDEVPEFVAATAELNLHIEARVSNRLDKVYVRIHHMGGELWEFGPRQPIQPDSSTIPSAD